MTLKDKGILFLIVVLVLGAFVMGRNTVVEEKVPTYAEMLFESKTDYIGDANAVAGVYGTIGFGTGGGTFELQTSEEPYGIKLFYDKIPYNERALFEKSSLLIGLVKNLSYVELYEGEELILKTTVEDANGDLGFNIKEIGEYKERLDEYLEKVKMVNG